MIATGLLWYDDDARRPLAVKIADAAQRFRERIGYEPTTCQLNPALAEKAANDRPKRGPRRTGAAPAAPELAVRIEPSESLRPNYFFVGVQAGDKLKRVRGWQSPDLIDDERRGRRTANSRAAAPHRPARDRKAAAPAPAPVVAATPPQVVTSAKPAKPVAKAAKPPVTAAPPQAPAIAPARVTKAAKPAKPATPPEIAKTPRSAPVGVKAPKAARRAVKDAPIPAQETSRDAATAAPLAAKSVR
ncbi:MAG TPA: hypothetical protein VGR88_05115, partial [Ktedonobacterales bacterium]|nr:hypothetical protein [Ktedonobacterales bacterium]